MDRNRCDIHAELRDRRVVDLHQDFIVLQTFRDSEEQQCYRVDRRNIRLVSVRHHIHRRMDYDKNIDRESV